MSKLTPREILSAGAVVPVMAIDDLSTAVDYPMPLSKVAFPPSKLPCAPPSALTPSA